ncbi:hypothetical protein BZB76_0312 [Actinomadura pelletieri DSM 43383]|uniref:Uncharacterized protein n=1 Tax=Actinomadura pelletieri DSM 43383 TaxID=1120940 RepID=A0A495QXM5_9ACTN|nr:hypothetical protein [Actinomadura pelletieri]RKS78878.1 hypothetical protein BZB76_0312 [Actinomadura pelletieri DSM 43383]
MSDTFEAHASGVHGGMHAGAGDINHNYYLLQSGPLGVSPRKLPVDELRWLRQRFVEPTGLGKARDILEATRTVLLDGLTGSGRTAAAKMLLWEVGGDGGRFHELLLQEGENVPPVDHSHVGDGELVWMDLSQLAEPRWHEVRAELSSLRATVQDRDARLVLVLPDKTGHLGSTLDPYRAEIQRPAVEEVLYRYLRVEEICQPNQSPPSRFLDTDWRMEDVSRYIELIRRARVEHREGTFEQWCEDAHRAFSGQLEDVTAQVAGLAAGRQRALLLAVAMLHNAHADVIHHASAALLETVAHPREESPILERAPLDLRLKEIGAEIDASSKVRFKKLDYDAAVRSYFWTYMPELHSALQDWIEQTANSQELESRERAYLIERFTEQCLNERYRQALFSLVEKLTAAPTTRQKMEAAALVLQRGLRDKEQARPFRRKIYEWSRSNNLSNRLAEVIIAACRDEMMTKYPDEALVRLHHVARRERGTRARETLVELAGSAPRLRRQMLARLTEAPPEAREWPTDVDLFLDLADPEALTDPGWRDHALISERTVRRQLTIGWALVFARRPCEMWVLKLSPWLQVAAADQQHRNALLSILVRAGRGNATALAQLYTMTREKESWALLSDPLIQLINTLRETPDHPTYVDDRRTS